MDDLESLRQLLADVQAQPNGCANIRGGNNSANARRGTILPVNERNAVELVMKLMKYNRCHLVFSEDGQEYLTQDRLEHDICNHLIACNGRSTIADIAQRIGVEPQAVLDTVETLINSKKEPIFITNGGRDLLTHRYVEHIAQEIAELVAASSRGTILVSDVVQRLDLDQQFLYNHVLSDPSLRRSVIVDSARGILYNDTYTRWVRSRIRGILCAATRPMPLAPLSVRCGLPQDVIDAAVTELVDKGLVNGTLTDGHATYVPKCFTAARGQWVQSFYTQNGFIEFRVLENLNISTPEVFVVSLIPPPVVLKTLALSPNTLTIARSSLAAALEDEGVCDITGILPPALTDRDIKMVSGMLLTANEEAGGSQVLSSAQVVGGRFVVGSKLVDNARTALKEVLETPKLAERLYAVCPSSKAEMSSMRNIAEGGDDDDLTKTGGKKSRGRKGGNSKKDRDKGRVTSDAFNAELTAVLREVMSSKEKTSLDIVDEILDSIAEELSDEALTECMEAKSKLASKAANDCLLRAQQHTEDLTFAYLDACLGADSLKSLTGVKPLDKSALENHILRSLFAALLEQLLLIESDLSSVTIDVDVGSAESPLHAVYMKFHQLEKIGTNNETRMNLLKRLFEMVVDPDFLRASPKGKGATAKSEETTSTKGKRGGKKKRGGRHSGDDDDSDNEDSTETATGGEPLTTVFFDSVGDYIRGAINVKLPMPGSRAVSKRLETHEASLREAAMASGLAPPQALHLAAMVLYSHTQHCWLPAPPRFVHVLLDPKKLKLHDKEDATFLSEYHQKVVHHLRSKAGYTPEEGSEQYNALMEAEKQLNDGITHLQEIVTKEISITNATSTPASDNPTHDVEESSSSAKHRSSKRK